MSRSWRVLGVAVWLVTATVIVAQVEEDQLGVPTELEKAFRQDLFKSVMSASPSASEKAALENTAKYLVWRVTFLENVANPDKMSSLIKEFEQYYTSRVVKDPRKQDKAVEYLNSKMIDAFNEVFKRKFESNRISSINAAQMLPIVARTKSPEFGRYLLSLVKDPAKHDAVKLYALRGLREYGAVKPYPQKFEVRKSPKELQPEIDRVQILASYIERKGPAEPSKEEAAALGYLRREAVQALAQVQVPAVVVANGKVEGAVAVTLTRVLMKDQLDPPPTLAERLEAALALCNLKASEVPDFLPQVPTYAIAKTLDEFITAYRADFSNFKDKGKTPALAWKSYADRWRSGLDYLAKEVTSNPAASNLAKNMNAKTRLMLDNIVTLRALDDQSATDYRIWINNKDNVPAGEDLFKAAAEKLKLVKPEAQ